MTHTDFLTLPSGRQLHYRVTGKGPPLIILHPSPQNSEAMGASMAAFGAHCQCFALDTPGYGLSDDIPVSNPTMSDYADLVIAAADALGIGSFMLYGAATGSQIAIEIGKRYPDRLKLLMLDSNGHASDEERERLLEGYFPEVTPKRDGGHLLTYWDMCRNLFFAFPWNSHRSKDRFASPMPPISVIQDTLLRYLMAGENYAKAYRVAFEAESRSHMDGLNVPATMTRWEGSPILSLADAMIAEGLPECVRLLRAGPSIEERFAVQVEAVKETISTSSFEAISKNPPAGEISGDFKKQYLNTAAGQVLARVSGGNDDDKNANPIVILHGAGESAQQMESWCDTLIEKRPVVIIDLPGHGGSCRFADSRQVSLTNMADTVADALATLDAEAIDIAGRGLGGAIAALVSKKIKTNRIAVVDPPIYEHQEEADRTTELLPDISPQIDGSHLVKTWAMVRDSLLYRRWPDLEGAVDISPAAIAPSAIHTKTCDILKCGDFWPRVKRMEMTLDWADILDDAAADVSVILLEESIAARNSNRWSQSRTVKTDLIAEAIASDLIGGPNG